MERKSITSFLFFSLLHVARRIWGENFPVITHCVYQQGCDAVRKGNVPQPSFMKSVHSFQPGTALSYPQNRAIREENSLIALTLFQREPRVQVDPDVTVNEVGGEVGSIACRKNNPRLSEHHTAGCHIGCCSQTDTSYFAIYHLMLGTEISPSSLHFSSQRECPWEGMVPLRQ